MHLPYPSSFLNALGWSLIDSLWQMGTLWIIYTLITRSRGKSSASFRYLLGLGFFSIGSLWFLINIGYNYYYPANSFSLSGLTFSIDNYLPFIATSYLLVIIYLIFQWFYQCVQNSRISHTSFYSPESQVFQRFLDQLRSLYNLRRNITLSLSKHIRVPQTVGVLKPIILLPISALTQLNATQIEALIAHEFYHIKRNDYLVHILTSFMGSLLFFNPFAQWLLKYIHEERENCCDDEVIGLGYERWDYAHALYTVSKNVSIDISQSIALAATGKGKQELLLRIKRLLNVGSSSGTLTRPLIIFFLVLMITGQFSRTTIPVAEQDISLPSFPAAVFHEVSGKAEPEALDIKSETFSIGKETSNTAKKVSVQKISSSSVSVKLSSPVEPPTLPSPPLVNMPVEEFVPAITNDDAQVKVSFIAAPIVTISFSFVESEVNSFPKPANTDPTQPYIPGSTFYFPDHDIQESIKGKTVIDL